MYNAQKNSKFYANCNAINVHVVNCTHDEVCDELMRLFNACNNSTQYNVDALHDALNAAYEEDYELTQEADTVLARATAQQAIAAYEDEMCDEAQHYALLALLTRNMYLQKAVG